MPSLLITIDDIKQFRAVSLDQKRAEPYILEAMENDLRPVLNDALYRDFTQKVFSGLDPDYAKYQNLLNGTTYTVNGNTLNYPGVKAMLVYYSLSRIVLNNQINVTSYGVVQKTLDQSQPVEAGMLKMMVTELRSIAISYQNRVADFLENNKSTYPLYGAMEPSTNNITGLKFFAG